MKVTSSLIKVIIYVCFCCRCSLRTSRQYKTRFRNSGNFPVCFQGFFPPTSGNHGKVCYNWRNVVFNSVVIAVDSIFIPTYFCFPINQLTSLDCKYCLYIPLFSNKYFRTEKIINMGLFISSILLDTFSTP